MLKWMGELESEEVWESSSEEKIKLVTDRIGNYPIEWLDERVGEWGHE